MLFCGTYSTTMYCTYVRLLYYTSIRHHHHHVCLLSIHIDKSNLRAIVRFAWYNLCHKIDE